MTYRKFFTISLLLLITVYFYGCRCGCGDPENTIRGRITIIGNEPFTKLALETEEGKFVILKCSKELNAELWKKQSQFYLIQYSDKQKEEFNEVVIVEKAIPFKKESK